MTAPCTDMGTAPVFTVRRPLGVVGAKASAGYTCAGPGTTPARFYRLVWFGSDTWELFPGQSLGFKGFGNLHVWICSWEGWGAVGLGGAWLDRRMPQAPHVLWAALPAPPSHVSPVASSPSLGRVYLFEQRLGRGALQRRVSPARLQDCSVQSPPGVRPGQHAPYRGGGGGLFFMLTVQLFSTPPSFSLPRPLPAPVRP